MPSKNSSRLFACIFFFFAFTNIASAQTITTCGNLNVDGTTYQLINNIEDGSDTCIQITASNITFDGAGFTIGNYSLVADQVTNALNATNVTNITVKNVRTYYNFDFVPVHANGFVFQNVTNSLILNNSIYLSNYNGGNQDLMGSGIFIDAESHNNNISNNTVTVFGHNKAISIKSNNNIVRGGTFSSAWGEYNLSSPETNNTFIDTDFTAARTIAYDSNAIGFNYSNDSIAWINSTIPDLTSIISIRRSVSVWSQTNISFTDSVSSGTHTVNYSLYGLLSSARYQVVYGITSNNITTDAAGHLAFNITTSTTPQVITILLSVFMPPAPSSLSSTQARFWINNTWTAGVGNTTDLYNISVNGSWVNGSAVTFYNSTGMSPRGWSNISVYAYNNTGNGTLNTTPVSQNTQLANNAPILTNISTTYIANVGDTLQIYPISTDADADTPTFGNITTKGVFYSGNGTFIWTILAGDSGTYNFQINSSDSYGGIDYQNFSVSVNSTVPGAVTDFSNSTGNFFTNISWLAGVNTNSYNISLNNDTWINGSAALFYNATGMSPHGWSNITVYGFNTSSSVGVGESYSVQIPNNAPSSVTGVSLSSSSFLTTEKTTITLTATDPDSDNLTVTVEITGISYGGNPLNYTMTQGSNNTYSYEYSTSTAGTYSISGIYSLDNYSSTTKTTSALTFTVSTPTITSGGGGGGGGSTTTIVFKNDTSTQLAVTPILQLKNLTTGVVPLTEEISNCLTDSLFMDNACSNYNFGLVVEPSNLWTYTGAFLGSLIMVFVFFLYNDDREIVMETLLYGVLTIMIGAFLVSVGFNIYIGNYIMDSSKYVWTFLTFVIFGGVIAGIGDAIFHHKTKAEKHKTYRLNLEGNPFRNQ